MVRSIHPIGPVPSVPNCIRRRALLLGCMAVAAQGQVSNARVTALPGILAPEEGWRRIHRALNDPDVGTFTVFDLDDLREILRHQPIRVTEGCGHVQRGGLDAAKQAIERHMRHCPGPYAGWITLVASSKANVGLRRSCRVGGETHAALEPRAATGTVLCGLGMYLDESLGDALRVTVVSVQGAVNHRLIGPLLSEPWKW